MSARRPGPLFLQRRSYRNRRLTDACRLLPAVGLLFWSVPLLWARGDAGPSTSAAIIYVFSVWVGLTMLAGLLARSLPEEADTLDEDEAPLADTWRDMSADISAEGDDR